MLQLFLSAFGLGLTIVATPGTITVQAVRTGLERGFGAALSVQIGALAGVVLWGGVGLMGATLITENMLARLFLSSVSIVLLLWLMVRALRDAVKGQMLESVSARARDDFVLGVVLSLVNPLPFALWLGIGSGMISSPSPIEVVVLFGGLISSAMLWSFFLAAITAWGQRFITPLLFRIVSLMCGLALGVIAVKLARNVIMLLIGS
jgi:chemosensory pili system protein ChpE